jgi:hypothetical protein
VSAVLLVQADPSLHEQWTEALSRSGHEVLAVRDVGETTSTRASGIAVPIASRTRWTKLSNWTRATSSVPASRASGSTRAR